MTGVRSARDVTVVVGAVVVAVVVEVGMQSVAALAVRAPPTPNAVAAVASATTTIVVLRPNRRRRPRTTSSVPIANKTIATTVNGSHAPPVLGNVHSDIGPSTPGS